MSRLRLILLGGIVAALAGAAVAYAATTIDYTVTVSPAKAGTKTKPRSVSLHAVITASGNPSTTSRTVLSFDKNLQFNGKYFKSCSSATLLSGGPNACPRGSKVGTGSAVATFPGFGGIPLNITAFNGPGGKKLELYLAGSAGGLPIQKVLEGTIGRGSGPYGTTLTVNIPADVQRPLGSSGPFVPLTKFDTTIHGTTTVKRKVVTRKHHRKVTRTVTTNYGYVASTGCPSDKLYKFGAAFTFANNAGGTGVEAPLSKTATSPCSK